MSGNVTTPAQINRGEDVYIRSRLETLKNARGICFVAYKTYKIALLEEFCTAGILILQELCGCNCGCPLICAGENSPAQGQTGRYVVRTAAQRLLSACCIREMNCNFKIHTPITNDTEW